MDDNLCKECKHHQFIESKSSMTQRICLLTDYWFLSADYAVKCNKQLNINKDGSKENS